MDDILNTVDAVQENAVGSQTEQVETNVETVNADSVSATADKQETKPVQSAEDNARFAEVRRKAEAEARDKVIDEMYGASHNIHTYAEYQASIERQKQEEHDQTIREQYEAKGLPDDVVEELVEWKKDREQSKAEKEEKQKQAQRDADMMDFIKEFPDVKPDDIPVEVWQANERGVPLRYAYAEHAYKMAKKAEEIAKANAENAKSSTGTVTGDGVANEPDFISYDVFEKNKSDTTWVANNYNKIQKSRANW
jgi:hypothetical protein